MRTLVISDLHLGARRGDVLRDPAPRSKLIEAMAGADRLVLLGDVLELRHGPLRDAVAAAGEVLAEVGAALGPGKEVVVVAGNHDHLLIAGWLQRRFSGGVPAPLELETPVQWLDSEPLQALAAALAPATMRAAYPGVWLREDVYATHGHFSDRHTTVPMLERIAAAVTAKVVREPAGGPRKIEDYEAVLAPVYAWVDAVAQSTVPLLGAANTSAWGMLTGADGRRPTLRRRAVAAGFPAAVAALNLAGLGPLRSDVSGAELRRAGLRAFGEVLSRLGVTASYAIFGHTHRAGPVAGEGEAQWRSPAGTRLLNTGSWTYEPQFLGKHPERSPYRPGFAAAVGPEGPPELVNLLD